MTETPNLPNASPHIHDGTFAGMHSHDGGALHWHDEFGEHTAEQLDPELAALRAHEFTIENVVLTTVGVDIGSSTSHLMFSRVHAQRIGEGSATRFVIVGREVLWKSPVIFTPYLDDDTIDAARLERFVVEAYHYAAVGNEDIDSGAVVLTGEALKRKNSNAIGGLFAKEIGRFVCASAGHHLEAILAANGSGTVSRSRRDRQTLMNVDIGGGTTKLALVQDGEILGTAAVAIGARLMVKDENRRLTRLDEPARRMAEHLGIHLAVGQVITPEDEQKIVQEWTTILAGLIKQQEPTGIGAELMLTDPLLTEAVPKAVTFSGGVSEYVYLRETRDFRDSGAALAKSLRRALMTGVINLPVVDPGQGIRATAIGASQFTVQVSDNPYVTDEAILPLRNLPVLDPRIDLTADITVEAVAAAIRSALDRASIQDGDYPIALGFRWQADPTPNRIRALAEGIRAGIPITVEQRIPFAVLTDHYATAQPLGRALKDDVGVPGDLVSLDGVTVNEFDFIDVGEIVHPTEVVAVSVKSLLFAGGLDRRSIAKALTAAQLESMRVARAEAEQQGLVAEAIPQN